MTDGFHDVADLEEVGTSDLHLWEESSRISMVAEYFVTKMMST